MGWLIGVLAGCIPTYATRPVLDPTALSAPRAYQWIDVDDITWAHADTGGDGDPVVLVHGLSSHAGFWRHQVDALAKVGYRVVVVDLPGFGASDRPDAPYTPPWFADRLVALFDALDLDQVHLVGHSMGGQIGLTLALDHPDRIASLALAAPAGIETFQRGHGEWLKNYWTEDRTLSSREADVRRSFALVFHRRDEHVETLIEERVRMGRHAAFAGTSVAVSRSIAGMIDHPVAARLHDVQHPTLVVFGRRDGLIPNPIFNGGRTATIARRAHAAIPGAEVLLIPRAGHTVMFEAPDAFNTALLDFLSRHPMQTP